MCVIVDFHGHVVGMSWWSLAESGVEKKVLTLFLITLVSAMSYHAPNKARYRRLVHARPIANYIGSWQSEDISLVFTSVTGQQQLAFSNQPPRNVVEVNEKALSVVL